MSFVRKLINKITNKKQKDAIKDYLMYKSLKKKSINREKILYEMEVFKGSGLNSTPRKTPIILSMTSFPGRIYDVHFAVFSLLKQTVKPDKIILWLAEEEFPNKSEDLPKKLLELQKFGLTINYCESIRPFKKIIPTYRQYGENSIIITADDDNYYAEDWLEKLYNTHLEYPEDIICHRVRKIVSNKGKIKSYTSWPLDKKGGNVSFLNFITSTGGVLYPPNSLHENTCDIELFKNLTPNNDDIWVYFMAILNNKMIRVPENPLYDLIPTNAERALELNDDEMLWTSNRCFGENDKQFLNVLEHYSELKPHFML